MGLFSKKDKEEKELPKLKFPEVPDNKEIPTYESSIKEAVKKEDFSEEDFPKIESRPIMEETPLPKFREEEPKIPALPPIEDHLPKLHRVERTLERSETLRPSNEEKVLFIKVEKYEEVVETLKTIKMQIADAENVIRNLEDSYKEEERQVAVWKNNLEHIKSKIMDIDKKLYTI